MIKIISLLLTVLFSDLFAVCSNTPTTWGTGSYLGNYTTKVSGTLVNTWNYPAMTAECSSRFSGINLEIACSTCTATNISVTTNGNYAYCIGSIVYTPNPCPVCGPGTYLDPDGTCHPNPIVKCGWAVAPWLPTTRSEANCNNYQKGASNDPTSYLWNYSWCSTDKTCYAREYYCPIGQTFDMLTHECKFQPLKPTSNCSSGWYKSCKSVKLGNQESCSCDYICKDNPNLRYTVDVSCGAKPVDPTPTQTCPTCPTSSDPNSESTSNKDRTDNCFASESLARMNCLAPNILSFQCDPTTGIIKKNECKAPTLPTQSPVAPSDSTTNSTSKDIKDLGNSLPTNIRDALKDFFTDGSMPHLEAIRGSLQALNIQTGDTNDKLDSISASTDAGLVLQADTNTKLDGIKTSTDGVKSSVDGVKDSVDGLKTSVDSQRSILQTISDFFTGSSSYNGSAVPSQNDLKPDDTIKGDFDTFTNSIQQTKDQFDQAYNLFSVGVPNVSIGGGSCPSFSFFGNSYSLSKVGESIAPYSSVFSILIYIALMFKAFRLVFSFFSKGI